ncbi:MAG: hypothetical protein ACFE94_09915 [Candidatus Hodarchaeota archaeon]
MPILKGSIVQCPYCGAKNLYMESFYTLKYYMSDILKISSLYKSKKVNPKEILRRKILIESYFSEIKISYEEYRHLIITKLDLINVDPVKLFYLIRASGNFEIIIDRFLLNYLNEDSSKKRYLEFRDKAYIINKSLLGLYYSYLAKNSTVYSKCCRFYKLAENNYQNVVDYCNITMLDNDDPHLYKTRKFYSILVKFTIIIKNILDKNPKLYSNKLEDLLKELENIPKINIHIYNLHKQIEDIIQLERDTCMVLENIRVDDPFLSKPPFNEEQIVTTDENLNEVNRVRNWINNLSEKYQKYQNGLLKLHSGRIIKYLSSYREEFITYKNKNAEMFDQVLGSMVNKALESYNYETLEAIDTLSHLMQKNIYNGNLIDKFKIEHDDLIEMDEVLKNFVNNLFTKPLLRNLESEYYRELISIISGKHTEFDKHILKYINRMLKDFEYIRNKKVLSLEEQRNQFISEIKPNLQKLIDLSFTLNEEILPYPLFIDIKIPDQKLRVNNPETLTLIIENPNITDITNIKIYFFISDSFQNKLEFTKIKRLKASERRKIKLKITAKEKGTFPSMVMIDYQHFNKTFWMPSIKFKLEVEERRRFSFYPITLKEYYQAQANNILRFVRNYV